MTQRNYIYVTLTVLLLTLSCGFFESTPEEPAITVDTIPTLTPTPEGISAELQQLPADLTISSGLETLSSYAITLSSLRSEDSIEIVYQKDNVATAEQFQVTPNGVFVDNVNDGETATVIIVDDRVYVQYGVTTGWVSVSIAEASIIIIPDSSLIDTFVGALPQSSEPEPQIEQLNGLTAYRYQFTNHPIGDANTQGSIWLDPTGSYIMKYEATSMDGTTPFEMSYELSNINEALGIALTEEAQNATSLDSGSDTPSEPPTATPIPLPTIVPPAEIPMLDDVQGLSTTADSVTYSTNADMVRTVDFYNTSLTNGGWEIDADSLESDSDNFKVNYLQGSRLMTIDISTLESGQLQIYAILKEG